MTETVITDAGIFVALIDKKDRWHEWADQAAEKLLPPFVTCEAAITEANYLLRNVSNGQQQLLSLIEKGLVQIDFSLSVEIVAIRQLMRKYADVPMDFADACLVRMSETIENSIVFTLDSDFWVYRKNGKEPISLIIPSSN